MKKINLVITMLAVALLGSFSLVPCARAAVDLELVLSLDVSASIFTPQNDFITEHQGYVDAFNNAAIFNAIQNGVNDAISVSVVYWAERQVTVIPFTLIDSFAASQAFATLLAAQSDPSIYNLGTQTGLGNALAYSGTLFGGTCKSPRCVIDVSGDGVTNINNGVDLSGNQAGSEAATSAGRASALAAGTTTINGITVDANNFVQQHYKNFVIGGTNAFHVHANTFADFDETILAKLLTEIGPGNGGQPGIIPEPSTLLLLTSGIMSAFLYRRKFA